MQKENKNLIISRQSLEDPWKESMKLKKIFTHLLRHHVCEEDWHADKVADLCTAYTLAHHYNLIATNLYETETYKGDPPEGLRGKGECVEVSRDEIIKFGQIAITLTTLCISLVESYGISLELH